MLHALAQRPVPRILGVLLGGRDAREIELAGVIGEELLDERRDLAGNVIMLEGWRRRRSRITAPWLAIVRVV